MNRRPSSHLKKVSHPCHMGGPSRSNPAVLRQVAADRVDDLRTLTHHQIACAEHEPCGLLLLAFHCDKTHAGPLRCLADRLRIDCIVLVPFHEGLHVGRRDQPLLMPRRLQFTRSVMRAAACFERDNTCVLRGKKLEQLSPGQLATENHGAALIRAMRMKNALGDIQTDCDNLRYGYLPQWRFNTSTLAHRCRRGASTPSALERATRASSARADTDP